MKLHELQYREESTMDKNNELWQKIIDDQTQLRNKRELDEAHYHSYLCTCYSFMYMLDECKKHAALMPDWAAAQEKTNALISVARVLVYEKKIAEALDYYQQAYNLDAEHEVVIEEAGWCCFELGQWEQAGDWFIKGITLLEENLEPFWEGLGLSLAKQEKYEEALPAFKHALELCDEKTEGYYFNDMIGQCYANLNDFYRALGHYTQSLDANPTYAPALTNIAALYYNQEGNMKTAIDYLKKAEAITEQGDHAMLQQLIYINLSKIYKKLKEFELYEFYQTKLMESLGFEGMFGFDDENEDKEKNGN